jgi:hypothetical protein
MEATKKNLIGAEVNQLAISEAAHKIVKGEFVGIMYMTEPSMKKTDNPFVGDCVKVTYIVCQAGVSYGNSLENRTGEKQEVEPMRGKHHIDWIIAQADKDPKQFYICLQRVADAKTIAKYFHKNGTAYTAEEVETLKGFFYEKTESPKQVAMGLVGKAQVQPFQVKLENVISIKQGCTLYEYQTKYAFAY